MLAGGTSVGRGGAVHRGWPIAAQMRGSMLAVGGEAVAVRIVGICIGRVGRIGRNNMPPRRHAGKVVRKALCTRKDAM